MLLEPTLVLLVGIEIIQHDVKLAVGKGGNDLVHEAKEFDAPAPLFVLAQNLAGRDIESREQGRRPMPLVVVALAGQRPPGRQLQIALRPLQGLDRGLLIDAEHDGLAGAGRYRGRRHRLPWRQNPDRCFRTRTCGLLDRSSDCAGSARHIAHRYRKAPPPEAGRSSAQSPSAAACRATPKSSCPSPSCRSALCPGEACPEDLQARHRQSAAANGSRFAAGRQPPWRSTAYCARPPPEARSALASNRAVSSPATGSAPPAHHVPCAKAGLLLLRESSRP